jgi:Recombinase/Recombinase zinc beta ribbon domain
MNNWDTARRRAVERGVHPTAVPPYGYRRREDNRLEPIPALVAVVNEIFEQRAAGSSGWSISTWLNEEHPRTDGREWTGRNVESVIRSRAYLGEAFHGEHRNPNAHRPIVAPSLFVAASSIGGERKATKARNPAFLSGLIRCAGCRYAMSRKFTTYITGERVEIYACARRFTGGKCAEPATIVARRVEPLVVAHSLALVVGSEGAGPMREVAERWTEHGRARQAEALRRLNDSVYVRKGRGDRNSRVMILPAGEDDFERPRRGAPGYRVKPIPWPQEMGDPHFLEIPRNARDRHVPAALAAAAILGERPVCHLLERSTASEGHTALSEGQLVSALVAAGGLPRRLVAAESSSAPSGHARG